MLVLILSMDLICITLTVENASGYCLQGNVAVNINIDDATNLSAFQFDLYFDEFLLQAISAETTQLTSDFMIAYNVYSNYIKVAAATNNPIQSGSGAICIIKFNVIANTNSESLLDLQNSLINDLQPTEIDGIFIINCCQFIINSPNGGETFYKGSTYNITWSKSGSACGSNVKIELYKGGSYNSTITSSTSNNGSYSWTVPTSLTSGSDYKIKITDTSNSNYYDYSDNDFSILGQTFGNCDGDSNPCDINDVQISVNMNLGLIPCSPCADCEPNGNCSITDVQKMVNCNLGIPVSCH